MLAVNDIRKQLAEEIRKIPDAKLPEVLDVIHYFRVGLESSIKRSKTATNSPDKPKAVSLEKIRQCIHQPNTAALGDFRLNLDGYRFDREEANER